MLLVQIIYSYLSVYIQKKFLFSIHTNSGNF